MTEPTQPTPKAADGKGAPPLEKESGADLEKGESLLRVEQDNRVERVREEAKQAGQGGETPARGINPDG